MHEGKKVNIDVQGRSNLLTKNALERINSRKNWFDLHFFKDARYILDYSSLAGFATLGSA